MKTKLILCSFIVISIVVGCGAASQNKGGVHTTLVGITDEHTSELPPVEIALTVDDMPEQTPPNLETHEKIFDLYLNAFAKHNLTGVYGFVNHAYVDNPAMGRASVRDGDLLLKRWVDGGQLLANHTYSHLKFKGAVSQDDFKKEIMANEPALKKLMPGLDYKWFRYPGLQKGKTVADRLAIQSFLASKDYKIAEVSLNFSDIGFHSAYAKCTLKKDSVNVEKVKQEYLKAALSSLTLARKKSLALYGRPVSLIMLVHMNAMSGEMMDPLIKLYLDHGVKFVSLAKASKDPVYKANPEGFSDLQAQITHHEPGAKMFDVKVPDLKLCP